MTGRIGGLKVTLALFTLACLAVLSLTVSGQRSPQGQQAEKKYDILLKGGHVIDPKNNIDAVMDVATSGSVIAKVARNIPAAEARKVVNVAGYYVTPGLIDIHTHVYAFGAQLNVFPDDNALPYGVTTVVDAGSSGWKNFEDFKAKVIDVSKTRVLAFLNIVGAGMFGEVEQDVNEMDPKACADMIKKYPDIIVGVKVAHFRKPTWDDVDRAVEAGRLSNTPVMVDFREVGVERTYKELLLKHMRPGDIHTHMYAQHLPQLDENNKVSDFIWEAKRRGIIFDVGHGAGSFWFRVAAPAIKQGHLPDSISTDIHKNSILIPNANFTTTMSKFLNLGMSLKDIISRCTVNPAKQIRRKQLGHLSEGATADIAVLQIVKGKFGFVDSGHAKMVGDRKIECVLTVRDGKIVWDPNGLSWPDWRTAGRYVTIE